MNKVQIQVASISSAHNPTSYTLIMEELEGDRKLLIIIGIAEAQSIATAIEEIQLARPMTHDLFKAFADAHDIKLLEVVIHRLEEGVFYSNLVTEFNGRVHEIDSRTSDAIALALRFDCPIFINKEVMEEAGIMLSDIDGDENENEEESDDDATHLEGASIMGPFDKPSASEPGQSLTKRSLEELQIMLQDALDVENYGLAAKIRDEINKRNNES